LALCTVLAWLTLAAVPPVWEVNVQATPRGGPLLVASPDGKMSILLPMGDQGLGGWDGSGAPLPGYPVSGRGGVVQRPALATDGSNPLIAWADNDGTLHLTDMQGVEQPGWPVDLGARPVTGVSALDLDEDGSRELAVGTSDAMVHLVDIRGSELPGWPMEMSEKLLWQPVQMTMGGDQGRAIVLALANTRLTAVDIAGHTIPGWPVQVGFPAGTIPITADINSDGLTDVIFATQNRRLYAVDSRGHVVEEWPFMLDDRAVRGPAAVGVLDPDLSQPQAAVSTRDSVVYLLDGDCSLAGTWRWPNWPEALPSQPIITRTTRGMAVVVGCEDGSVHAWNASGAGVEGFPFDHGQRIVHPPAAGEITGHGSLELAVVGVGGKLAVYPLSSMGATPGPWPQTLSDAHNTGSYGLSFLPTAEVAAISGEHSGVVEVPYEIRGGTSTGVSVAYSTDAGYSWTQTTSYDRTGSGIAWRSVDDLPSGDHSECVVRITPFSPMGPGIAGMTPVFRLDNNQAPTIYLNRPKELQNHRYELSYAVEDAEGDTIQLQAQYSLDGGNTWLNAHLTGATVEIEPWLYGEPVQWNARSDLGSVSSSNVALRVRAADNDPGPWQTLSDITVDTDRLPSGQILAPTGEVSGRVTLGVRLSDPERNPLDVSYEYSTDGGLTWQPATVTEPEEGAPSTYEFEIVWESGEDEPAGDYIRTRVRAVPEDVRRGVAVPSSPFHLDNNSMPSIEIRSPGSWDMFRGVVPVSFTAHDTEGDDVWVSLEYRDPEGGDWHRAEGVVSSGPFSRSAYASVLRWNSSADFPGAESREVEIRLLAADRDTVRSSPRGPIIVENGDLPQFMQAGVASHDADDDELQISFELSDPEGRSLEVSAAYSVDDGDTWRAANVSGDLRGLSRGDYAGSLTWHYRSDVRGRSGRTLLRLTPTFGDNAGTPRILEMALGR